ncbi:MAG: radical SAM protein [Thermodesulfobacteriota bacterium]|nr:radical SAM protein [Thermodesulfobacteriota bacterium]
MKPASKPFVVPVFLPHSGCPHRCIYCDQTAITATCDEPAGIMAPEKCRAQIEQFLPYKKRDRGKTEIAFYGGNFLGLSPSTIHALLGTAQAFIDSGHADGIRFSTRPDTITPGSLAIIQNYSVATIELGIQSMDNTVLSLSRRGHTAADAKQAIQTLKASGYGTGVQLMTHLPGDDGPQSLESARQVVTLKPDMARIYPTIVLSDSPLARQYQQGKYQAATLPAAVDLAKAVYLMFAENHIPVIRMGLQASQSLEPSGRIVAGPYHPAFGFLVKSAIFFDMTSQALNHSAAISDPLSVRVHPASEAMVRGLRNTNLDRLKTTFDIQTIHIIKDDTVSTNGLICQNRGIIMEDLKY